MSSLQELVNRDPAAVRCPYPIFAELRDQPLVFSPELGAWVASRYEDVAAILRDSERWSATMPAGPEGKDRGTTISEALGSLAEKPEIAAVIREHALIRSAPVLFFADPPEHRQQRLLLNGTFRPSRVKSLEPTMQQMAEGALDTIVATGRAEFDFVAEFAFELPIRITAIALGVDDAVMDTFIRWSTDLLIPLGNLQPSRDQALRYVNSNREFADYFRARINAVRGHEDDGLLAEIVNVEIDGHRFSEIELLALLQQFLLAGNETTTKLITNVVHYLARDSVLQAKVRADRALVETLIEETLRIEAPVNGNFRRAKQDIKVGDTIVPAGDHIWILYASGNHDERMFPNADVLSLERGNVRQHLSFGVGDHFCLGASFARIEARVATNKVLDKLTEFVLSERNSFPMADSFVVHGLTELWLKYSAL